MRRAVDIEVGDSKSLADVRCCIIAGGEWAFVDRHVSHGLMSSDIKLDHHEQSVINPHVE